MYMCHIFYVVAQCLFLFVKTFPGAARARRLEDGATRHAEASAWSPGAPGAPRLGQLVA